MNLTSTNVLDINETAEAIIAIGPKRTVIVEGDMGSGKTTLLKLLHKRLPDYVPVYFDSTTKEIGDMFVPMFDKIDDTNVVRYGINEELGFHYSKPVILMIDEMGKNAAVKNALLRIVLERETAGGRKLPEGSIVFATTNLSAEGVGDMLLPHHRNRLIVVRMRKSTAPEWVENFARPNGLHPSVIGWVNETPQLGESFTDVDLRMGDVGSMSGVEFSRRLDELNPHIYHPKAPWRTAFVTWRSLEAASDILWENLPTQITLQLLIGAIGERSARDLMAFVQLADDLPKMAEIQSDPMNAKIPDTAPAKMMVVDRALATMEYEWVSNWMQYLARLPRELQGVFVNTARKDSYVKRNIVVNCREFGDWCMENGWMYAGDKK